VPMNMPNEYIKLNYAALAYTNLNSCNLYQLGMFHLLYFTSSSSRSKILLLWAWRCAKWKQEWWGVTYADGSLQPLLRHRKNSMAQRLLVSCLMHSLSVISMTRTTRTAMITSGCGKEANSLSLSLSLCLDARMD